MNPREHSRSAGQALPDERADGRTEDLPYAVELWDADREAIERVVARALNAAVARAIFKAAQSEYPGRRLTLSRGERVVADSGR